MIRKFNDVRGPPVAAWVSTLRNQQRSEVVADYCGSFSWICRIWFDDGVEWAAKCAVPGRVMNGDEKIAREVYAMKFVKENTKIPTATGEPLGKILEVSPRPESGAVMRPDISDDLETIYRQVANIYLELSKHNFFPRIGSLSNSKYGVDTAPMTLKMNEVHRHGGVNVGNQVSKTFSSTTEYFNHVGAQDLQHLREQPNSVDDAEDARRKYISSSIFKAITPQFVSTKHDQGPFKLLCDDMRFGNFLINNAKDLKIVAVLDWEWSYAAPYQMLYSPPRWLAIRKPIDWGRGNEFHSRYKL